MKSGRGLGGMKELLRTEFDLDAGALEPLVCPVPSGKYCHIMVDKAGRTGGAERPHPRCS